MARRPGAHTGGYCWLLAVALCGIMVSPVAALGTVAARWVTVTSNILLETTAGTSYAFGTYSNQLRTDLGYTQEEIQTVASIGNIGLYFAVVAGIVYDRYGPKPCIVIGAVLSLGGYILMWAAAGKMIDYSVGLMSLYAFLWSHGSSWYDTVAIGINIQNFPEDRGSAVGLLKSFFGLSASIVTLVDNTIFPGDSVPFLLFLGILGGVSGLVALPTTFRAKLLPQEIAISPFEKRIFLVAMGFLGLLAAYLTTLNVLESQGVLEFASWMTWAMIPLLLLQLVLLSPVIRQRFGGWTGTSHHAAPGDRQPLLGQQPNTLVEESTFGATGKVAIEGATVGSTDVDNVPLAGSEADPPKPSWRELGGVLVDLNFWLLNVTFFAGCGGGLVIINNIAQMVQAAVGPAYVEGDEAVFVTILSVSNCFGRLVWGALSDRFKRPTRAGWWTIVSLSMAGSMFVTSIGSLNLLYFCCFWAGMSYGGYWALVAPLLADVWGTEWIAAIYTLASLCPALSSYVFSVALASSVYTQHQAEDGICLGSVCFRLTYIVLGIVNAVGCVAAFWLTIRVKRGKAAKAAIQHKDAL